MNPFFLFLLAIFSPLLLAITLLLPPYLGILGASYVIYSKHSDAVHPLAGKLADVFYIIDVYENLFTSWLSAMGSYSIPFYAVPLLLMPMFGMVAALWLTAKLSRKLMDTFQLGVQH